MAETLAGVALAAPSLVAYESSNIFRRDEIAGLVGVGLRGLVSTDQPPSPN